MFAAKAHLLLAAARDDGFDGQLADDDDALGLAVEQLPHPVVNLGSPWRNNGRFMTESEELSYKSA